MRSAGFIKFQDQESFLIKNHFNLEFIFPIYLSTSPLSHKMISQGTSQSSFNISVPNLNIQSQSTCAFSFDAASPFPLLFCCFVLLSPGPNFLLPFCIWENKTQNSLIHSFSLFLSPAFDSERFAGCLQRIIKYNRLRLSFQSLQHGILLHPRTSGGLTTILSTSRRGRAGNCGQSLQQNIPCSLPPGALLVPHQCFLTLPVLVKSRLFGELSWKMIACSPLKQQPKLLSQGYSNVN